MVEPSRKVKEVFMPGFAPARRDPFVSAKGPKTIFVCARPCGYLHLRPEYRWLRNSLRSDNARQSGRFGAPVPPRPTREA